MWVEKGLMSNNEIRQTKIRGFKGYEAEQGWVSSGDSEDTSITEEMKRPEPAQIVWYDPANWVQYVAIAPIGADLDELREVVESIY